MRQWEGWTMETNAQKCIVLKKEALLKDIHFKNTIDCSHWIANCLQETDST